MIGDGGCRRLAWCLLAGALLGPSLADADEGFLGLADLAAYRDALKQADPGPAPPVAFRDLWERPDAYQGDQVRVEGRIERRFRQPPQGAFPALTELWIVDRVGNPLCLVFPTAPEAGEPGQTVQFDGTFLRLIRYRGADAERVAPLIVGPQPPRVAAAAEDRMASGLPDAAGLEAWIAGLLAAGILALLGLQHLRRRPSLRIDLPGPPPKFLGPDDEAGNPPRDADGDSART